MPRRSQIPGSRFTPTDLQLLDRYLRWRKEGKSSSYIYDMNIYEKEPWLLQHVRHFRSNKNMWFYFCTRPKANSRVAGEGTWKTSGLLKEIATKDGVKVGTMQLISFRFKNVDKTTGWVMHEYILDDQIKNGSHQEVVLCRIEFKPGNDRTLDVYAPRLEPIVIGQPQPQPPPPPQPPLGEEQNQNFIHVQYLGAPPPRGTQQGIQQHQDFGSYGQLAHQQSHIPGLVEGPYQHYGYGNMAEYHNQSRRQDLDGSHSAQPYDPSQLPMDVQEHYRLAVQRQQLRMEKQQNKMFGQSTNLSSQVPIMIKQALEEKQWVEYSGPYSAHPYDPSQLPMELQEHQQSPIEQHQRQIVGQATHLSSQLPIMMNQAIEEKQYGQPYHQSNDLSLIPMENPQQDNMVGNLAPQLKHEEQNNVPLMTMNQPTETPHLTQKQQQPWPQATTNNLVPEHFCCGNMGFFEGLADPSQLPMELQEEYILGDQYQNFSMEQQQHQINGQATHLSSQKKKSS